MSIQFKKNAIGFISLDNVYNGTGFVMNDNRTVITCAHVINQKKQIHYSGTSHVPGTMNKILVQPVHVLPEYDIAVLKSEVDICEDHWTWRERTTFDYKEQLFYFGWSLQDSNQDEVSLRVELAKLTGFGKFFQGGVLIDFLEFFGVGVPGWSGGPVIDSTGNVVAMMAQASYFQGIRGGSRYIVNKAFSLKPLFDQ